MKRIEVQENCADSIVNVATPSAAAVHDSVCDKNLNYK